MSIIVLLGEASLLMCEYHVSFRFDVDWLIEKNHRDIRKLSEIPKEERVYFNGIHKRRNRLAEDPSETDISCLRKAYEVS